MKTSTRGAVDPFIVMDVMSAAARAEAAGTEVVHMEVGQPGTPAPPAARAAVAAALQDQAMGYTVSTGIPELRAGIAARYAQVHGCEVDPDRVIVTPGSSGAFLLAFTALFETGARVGVSEPGYPSYRQILSALGYQPVGLPTRAEAGHRLLPDDLAPGLDGLIVASPANPTGTILGRDGLSGLIDAAAQRGAAFISDEIYHGLHYDSPAASALEISDDVYVINSFSKYFSMTGWRIGWMVVPPDHMRTVERLMQNMFICAPHVSQLAALGALQDIPVLETYREVYRQNRARMLEALPPMGFDRIAPPDGAFYIYADVAHLTDDSRGFCSEILAATGVALTPGIDFDPHRGQSTVRFSYATTPDALERGLERLAAYMARRVALRSA